MVSLWKPKWRLWFRILWPLCATIVFLSQMWGLRQGKEHRYWYEFSGVRQAEVNSVHLFPCLALVLLILLCFKVCLLVCFCENVLVVISWVQVLNQVKASGKGNTPAQMEALGVNLVPDPLLGYRWRSAASLASWKSSISLKGNLPKTFLESFYISVLSLCVSHVRLEGGGTPDNCDRLEESWL